MGKADSKQQVTESKQSAWGCTTWSGRASQSPSDPEEQVRLSQEPRNLETREPGVSGEGGGQMQVTPGQLMSCREMVGRKEAGMGLSPPGILFSST